MKNLFLSSDTLKFSRKDLQRIKEIGRLTGENSFESVVGKALDFYEREVLASTNRK